MKRFTCILIAVCLLWALSSCININITPDGSSERETVTNHAPSDESSLPDTTDDQEDSTDPSDALDTDSSDTDLETDDQPNSTDKPASLGNVNNGVLKNATPQIMSIPQNMNRLEEGNATEENNAKNMSATAVLYTLDGDVVNWITERDFIYVITAGNNRLVVIDSVNMCPVYNTPLAGKPAEINIVGDLIYISLPDLCKIDIFSKADCQKQSSLYFDHEVSSFCLDGDYIFYSEHDQHCRVFRKHLTTEETTPICNENGGYTSFYFPKLYLNQEDRILYIGESGSSGSGLFYYNADSLNFMSEFQKNGYGLDNQTREIFHVGDDIFWGGYRLSDKNARELIGRYGTASYGSVVFASEEIVSTCEGLFLTDTYECVVNYAGADFDFEHILISDSYNIFFRSGGVDKNIIIGVNFNVQSTEQQPL